MGTGTAFQNYVKEFSNLDKATQQAVLSSGLLSKVQKEQLISQMELSASTATLTAEQVQERLATELNSEADAKALLAKSGLITEKELETGATVEITTAKLNEAVANGTLSTSDAAVIAGALGITGANTTATTSFGLLTKAVWANVKAIGAWLLTTPAGWATLAIGAIAGLTVVYQKATLTIDEATEALENSKSSYDSISDEVSQLTEELNECHSRMKELQDLGSLRSVVEDDELSKLQETNVELTRRLAILKEEQRLKAVDVAKDASNVMTTDVESQYSTIAIGGSDERGQKVKPEEEMRLAINAYREYAEEKAKIDAELLKDPENTELANESQKWQDKMDLAASRANEMAGYINQTEEAYKKVIDTGGTLTNTQTDLYNSSITLGNEYLDFTKEINGVNEAFENLDTTEKAQTLKDRYAKKTLSLSNGQGTYTVEDKEISDWINTLPDADLKILGTINFSGEQTKDSMQEALDYAKTNTDTTVNEPNILSFSDAWNSEDFENTRKELLSLAEAGQLTPETLQSTEEYNTLLEQTGLSAEEAAKKINALVSSSTQLQSMSTQISKMSDMLADKKNGTTASASDLAGFDATVKGLESWDEFERVMMSSKSSMKQCQQAANALATEWVNGSNFLANLTEENKQAYITQLDLMGVENANEVVTAALAQKKRELAAQTEYETLATEYNSDAKNRNNQITTDLANATIAEIAEIIAEGNVTADTTAIMAEFALSKIDVNNAHIDTSSDIEQIVAIANAAGASAEYVDTLRTALNNLQKAEQGKKQELPLAGIGAQVANTSAEINVAAARDDVESALNDIKNQIKENRIDPSDYIIKPSGSSSYKPSGGSGGSRGGSKTKETKQTIDWIERKITILNNKIDAFATKASDAWSSWTSRTKALNSEMETTKKLLTSVYGVSDKLQKKYNKQKSTAKIKLDNYVKDNSKVLTSSTIKKINNGTLDTSKLSKKDKKVVEKYKKLQKDYEKKAKKASQNPAADYYFSKANSVAKKYKLSPAIIKKIKNGTINISDYNESVANAIQKYQDYYDKGKDAQKSKKEAKQKLNELAQQNFELIQSKWDSRIGYQENRKNAVSDALNLAQSKGQLIGSAYYTKQKGINDKEISQYKKEEAELKKAMKDVPKYSEEWYNMKSKISEVHSKYVQLESDNAELQRSINELKFDRFDELINKFGDITDEANFLIDMLDSDNLFNSDNGSITNDGITAMGLTAQNYDVYLAQAEEYKKSIADLEQMYKNGEIGISDYNSKMRELQGGYRDSIKSANDAKKAVIDYVKQGLDAQNEALSKSIEKQKELLESERDLKEFQDKITNQNKNIANLRKQIAALEGDDSESNRKRLQQLKSDLQDAEKEQADTLYDRSVSEQEKALDDMLTKSQDAAEAYLKDSEKVFIDALNYVNANTSQVSQNLEKISKDLGFDISTYITNAWKDGGDAVGTYESTLSSNVPKITAQIQLITNAWKAQCEAADKAAKASAKAAAGTDETTKDTDKKGNSSNGSGNKSKTSSAKEIKRYITDHADKAKQKKSYYGVLNQYIYGKTGGKVLSVKEEVELAKMLGVSVKKDLSGKNDRDNILRALKNVGWGTTLRKLQLASFSTGGLIDAKSVGEDGFALVKHGESILTKEQTQALIDFRPAIPQFGNMMDILKNVSVNSRVQSPTYQIDNRTIVEGVATDQIVKEMEGVAQRQAENVVRKINSATYAKGVRR